MFNPFKPDYHIEIQVTVDRKEEKELFNLLVNNSSYLSTKAIKAITKFIKEQSKLAFKKPSKVNIEEIHYGKKHK